MSSVHSDEFINVSSGSAIKYSMYIYINSRHYIVKIDGHGDTRHHDPRDTKFMK